MKFWRADHAYFLEEANYHVIPKWSPSLTATCGSQDAALWVQSYPIFHHKCNRDNGVHTAPCVGGHSHGGLHNGSISSLTFELHCSCAGAVTLDRVEQHLDIGTSTGPCVRDSMGGVCVVGRTASEWLAGHCLDRLKI